MWLIATNWNVNFSSMLTAHDKSQSSSEENESIVSLFGGKKTRASFLVEKTRTSPLLHERYPQSTIVYRAVARILLLGGLNGSLGGGKP